MKRKRDEEFKEQEGEPLMKRARKQAFIEKLQRWQQLRTTKISVLNEPVQKACLTCNEQDYFKNRKAREIARGDELFSTDYGSVMGFGSNDCFVLGLSIAEVLSDDDESVPSQVHSTVTLPTMLPKVNRVRTISTGGMHTAALTVDGEVYAWGNPDEGALGYTPRIAEDAEDPKPQKIPYMHNVLQVKAGDSCTLFLDAKGQVFMCGAMRSSNCDFFHYPLNGISCRGPTTVPVCIPMPSNQKAVRVETGSGSNFAAVLLKDGRIATLGFAEEGALARSVDVTDGDRYMTDEGIVMSKFLTPQCISFPFQSKKVLSMASGSDHLLVVARDRGNGGTTLYGSGLNSSGQLGLPERVTSVHQLTEVKQHVGLIAAGPYHSFAVDDDGYRMFACGQNEYGQLGIGPSARNQFGFTPVAFPKPVLLTKIVAGNSHGMALDSRNTLYTWGFGTMGATGHPVDENDDDVDITRPTELVLETQKKILDFGGGGQHSAVVLSEKDYEMSE